MTLVIGFDARTAPPSPKKAKGAKLAELQREVVPLLLRMFATSGKDVPVATLSVQVGQKSPNFVATALGHGRGGGLKMWKSGTAIKACKENVAIAVAFLYGADAKAENVAEGLSMDEQEMLDAFNELPSVGNAVE